MTNSSYQNPLALVGRVLLALIFITSGIAKITGFGGMVQYIASQGLPLAALGTILAIVVEVGGGIALLVGFRARYAAIAIAVFSLVTALLFHKFWAAPAEQVMEATINFWKNVSIAGGMLMVAAFGPGSLSVDAKLAKA